MQDRCKTVAVIGANYGDEGKGKVVDALVRRFGPKDTVVVRHNSGSQAAHTVQWLKDDGHEWSTVRHAFGHFGSGSPAGAPTHLASKFVVNPLTFRKELQELRGKGVTPEVNVSPFCPVTTPYEMLLNQFTEKRRGDGRHGSCGVGFGLTVERENATCSVTVQSASEHPGIALDVAREYFAIRARAIGASAAEVLDGIDEGLMREDFVLSFRQFEERVTRVPARDFVSNRHVVFEGAQGLLLDSTRGDFPHVTRCRTGSADAGVEAGHMARSIQDVIYVTRSFLTRHGAGPLPGEESLAHTFDETNLKNEWQGHLRTGLLNLVTLGDRITVDCGRGPAFGRASIALTWLDWDEKADGMVRYRDAHNEVRSCTRHELPAQIEHRTDYPVSFVGFGPGIDEAEFLADGGEKSGVVPSKRWKRASAN